MKLLTMVFGAALLSYAAFGGPAPASASMPFSRDVAHRIHETTKAACLQALTPDHRAKVLAIIASFDSGSTSYEAAGAAVAALLSSGEISAIGEQHSAMVDSFHTQMNPDGPTPYPNRPPFPFDRTQAGAFLVGIVGNPGRVYSGMPRLPIPSGNSH